MVSFHVDTPIARPPAAVFAAVTDLDLLPAWQSLVVAAERVDDGDGPLRPGSRIREVRQVRGRRLEQLVEVTAHDPPRRFALRIVEGPLPIDGDLTLEPTADGGTLVRLHAHGVLRGPLRLATPLVAFLGRREMRRQYARLK
jgi:uncharacterized protein YndB with AHSA1/START domain